MEKAEKAAKVPAARVPAEVEKAARRGDGKGAGGKGGKGAKGGKGGKG